MFNLFFIMSSWNTQIICMKWTGNFIYKMLCINTSGKGTGNEFSKRKWDGRLMGILRRVLSHVYLNNVL